MEQSEIEASPAISLLIQRYLSNRCLFSEFDAEIFEIICYELADKIGDDDLAEDLIFCSEWLFAYLEVTL